jgi:hypothetical protein
MGGLLPDALLKQWQNALADPALRQLPYRIETNKWGSRDLTIAIYDAQGSRSESALGIVAQDFARRASALLA